MIGQSNLMEVRKTIIKRYLSKGRRYIYHAPTGVSLPDLPLDHPDMQQAIRVAERNADTASASADFWGGMTPVGLSETIAPMGEMKGRGPAAFHLPVGISSPLIAKDSTPKIISQNIKVGCMRMDMPGSKTCIVPVICTKWPAWRTSGVSSSMFTAPKVRSSPMRQSSESVRSSV